MLYRIQTEENLGSEFGYFIPASGKKVRVCRDDCPANPYKIVRPAELHLEYTSTQPGGDFCSGIGPLLARREVAHVLASEFESIVLLPIHVVKSSKRRAHAFQQEYVELCPRQQFIPWMTETRLITNTCRLCRRRLDQMADHDLFFARNECIDGRWVHIPPSPRKPGVGILMPYESIRGLDIFGFNSFLICTPVVKSFIESRGWSNVSFVEYGEVV